MLDYREDTRIMEIADYYGFDAQSRQLIEEMAELTAAVNRVWRKVLKCGAVVYSADDEFMKEAFRTQEMKNLLSEIADVEVCLAQMRYMLDMDALIDAEANLKISRQLNRILTEQMEGKDGI